MWTNPLICFLSARRCLSLIVQKVPRETLFCGYYDLSRVFQPRDRQSVTARQMITVTGSDRHTGENRAAGCVPVTCWADTILYQSLLAKKTNACQQTLRGWLTQTQSSNWKCLFVSGLFLYFSLHIQSLMMTVCVCVWYSTLMEMMWTRMICGMLSSHSYQIILCGNNVTPSSSVSFGALWLSLRACPCLYLLCVCQWYESEHNCLWILIKWALTCLSEPFHNVTLFKFSVLFSLPLFHHYPLFFSLEENSRTLTRN